MQLRMNFLEMSVLGSELRCEPSFPTAGVLRTLTSRLHKSQHFSAASWQTPLSVGRISSCSSRVCSFRRYLKRVLGVDPDRVLST